MIKYTTKMRDRYRDLVSSGGASVEALIVDAIGGGLCKKHGKYYGDVCPYCKANKSYFLSLSKEKREDAKIPKELKTLTIYAKQCKTADQFIPIFDKLWKKRTISQKTVFVERFKDIPHFWRCVKRAERKKAKISTAVTTQKSKTKKKKKTKQRTLFGGL